jgi:putative Holliday junction resolvase
MNGKGRILALDVGKKRIGIAVSDELRMIAQPHSTVKRGKTAVPRILALVSELEVRRVVVGLPLRLDGGEGEQAADARRFAAKLSAQAPAMDIVFWDERLSSVEAKERMQTGGRKQKHDIDAVAAAVILESFLNTIKNDE